MNKTQTRKTTKTKTSEDAKVSLDKREPLMEAAPARRCEKIGRAIKKLYFPPIKHFCI